MNEIQNAIEHYYMVKRLINREIEDFSKLKRSELITLNGQFDKIVDRTLTDEQKELVGPLHISQFDWGFECESKENPFGLCIITYKDDDCCVFCGEPDERK